MNTGGEAAEQIVQMSLEGFEVAAKITGAGAKNIANSLSDWCKIEVKIVVSFVHHNGFLPENRYIKGFSHLLSLY